jgi:hypothetical protein
VNSPDWICEYCDNKFSVDYFTKSPKCPKCSSKDCRRIPKSEKIDQYSGDIRNDPGFKLPSDWSD